MTYKYIDRADLFDVKDTVKDIYIIEEREVRGWDYLLIETNAVANIEYCRQCIVIF